MSRREPAHDRALADLLRRLDRADAPDARRLDALARRIVAHATPTLARRARGGLTWWECAAGWWRLCVAVGLVWTIAASLGLAWITHARTPEPAPGLVARSALLGAALSQIPEPRLLELVVGGDERPRPLAAEPD